jgi:Bardet-Biedl syndrome 9 protein
LANSSSPLLMLAVLLPRKLVVFNVAMTLGNAEHGTYFTLEKKYDHTLERSAFNFTYGPFGGISGEQYRGQEQK